MRVKRGLTRLGLLIGICAATATAFYGWEEVASAKQRLARWEQSLAQTRTQVERARNRPPQTDAEIETQVDAIYETIGTRVRTIYDSRLGTMADGEIGRNTAQLWNELPDSTKEMVLENEPPANPDQYFEFLALLLGLPGAAHLTISAEQPTGDAPSISFTETSQRILFYRGARERATDYPLYDDTQAAFRILVDLHPVGTQDQREAFSRKYASRYEGGISLEKILADGARDDLSEAYRGLVTETLSAFALVAGIWIGIVWSAGWVISGFRSPVS